MIFAIFFVFTETTKAYHDCVESCVDQSQLQCGDYGCCEGMPASACISCTYSGCRAHGETPTNYCPAGQLNPHNECFNGLCMPVYYCGVSSCSSPQDCQLPTPPPPPAPQCGSYCVYSSDCASGNALRDGCTQCINNQCQRQPTPPPPPGPQCNSACTRAADCSGDATRDGCSACLPGAGGGLTCQPPPQCNSTCDDSADCALAPNGCTICRPNASGARTCQPSIQCNSSCTNSSECALAPNGCTTCRPNASGANTCQPPVAPPPPGPQCNSACTRAADCSGDATRDGCSACLPGAGGGLTCQRPPQCGSTCTRDTDCTGAAARDGCTICDPVSKVCRTPTAPPPPGFRSDMCKCDGVEHTAIFPGQQAVITAFAKVEGADVNLARVTGMEFKFLPALPGSNEVIAMATQPVEPIINTRSLVRYKSNWAINVPFNILPKVPYRIIARPVCQPVTNNVLGTTTQKRASFLDDLIKFIQNLFRPGSNTQPNTPPPPPSTLPQSQQSGGGLQLQLKTITPAKITDKQCTHVDFQIE
jgi:hypothetical protein